MIIEIFSKTRIVQGLSEKKIRKLFDAGRVIHAGKGDVLVSEGQSVDSFYTMLTGKAQVFLPVSIDRPARIDLTLKNRFDCFGEYSFIDNKPASASVETLEDSAVFVISHDAFQTFLNKHKKAGYVVYKTLLTVLVERLRTDNTELDLFNLK
jgi:CRP/FNR family cyclic AMP-dependent transcriptional regulator